MSPDKPKPSNPKVEQAGASDESIQHVHAILLREKQEPAEGYSPMPLFILGFVSAVIFIVSIYFVHNRAGFDPLAYDERFDTAMLAKAGGGGAAAVDPLVAGKRLYNTCATCHQLSGQGVAGVYPPLAGSEWVTGSEERLIRILVHGLNGPVTVKGNTYNGAMPAFGNVAESGYKWSDDKIAHVLTYIRHEWGNNAPAVTVEKVKEVRTQTAVDRKKPWTAAELEAIP
ncbi:MAG: cytochrome c [Opitutaceae bacterium]|nr:cytochrome c [Opitutaceae bacterium]